MSRVLANQGSAAFVGRFEITKFDHVHLKYFYFIVVDIN